LGQIIFFLFPNVAIAEWRECRIARPPTDKEGDTPKFSFTSLDLSKNQNKKKQKSTVFLNLFQNLPSDGKQMWFFDNFCKKAPPFLQCGFNPLSFSYLLQWAKATLEENAKIVKEPQMLHKSCNLLIYNRLYLEIFFMQLTLSFSDTLLLFFAPSRRVCSSK